MKTVPVFEAKNRLSEIIAQVEHGEEFTITRHGAPVARIVSIRQGDQVSQDVEALISKLKTLSEAGKPVAFDVREAIEEGRD
jgi:prevent-host-death family protein